MSSPAALLLVACLAAAPALAADAAAAPEPVPVDETPGGPGEWGWRPLEGEASPTSPPAFVWRPQKGAARYELQCARDAAFAAVAYQAAVDRYNCHCPPRTFEPGTWHWRVRFIDAKGAPSAWSRARAFTVGPGAVEFPMPPRAELLGRIPKTHPRLFLRPEQLPDLRRRAQGDLKKDFDALVKECDRLLKNPPDIREPPTYPAGTVRLSEEWREIWWGNRTYTIRALNGAATLGFARLLGGNEAYGQAAKRILLQCARWDPTGATGYRYNDEAGMPYAYYFARTYTFVSDLLTDEEKAACREVMTARGREMYQHLAPRHIWQPYGSHSNRAWHFLGEVGVAFLGEIPEAEEWAWFAMNVFFNVYPAWCDDDGGWHEGVSYWASYIHRFTWWADVMRAAMGIDAYRKPYFAKAGYYAMYLQPPGTVGGGFGDLCTTRRSDQTRGLMSVLAAQARNGHWQWYVDAHGGPVSEGGYVGFIRGALPQVQARPPDDLPASRCFRGVGQAFLNTRLAAAADNVEVLFKSSPFGTQSHGYDANNSFMLYAFGERLLAATGSRDIHGSDHHRNWMWHTRSTNCITVGGESQGKNRAATRGQIVAFHTSPHLDYVAGEAGACYGDLVRRFTRHLLFAKPGLLLVYDRLDLPKPATLEWHLHAPTEMALHGQADIRVSSGKAACRVALLAPKGLALAQTNQFDPPPRARVKLTEYHLTAATPPVARTQFVALIRPHRAGETPPAAQTLHEVPGGYALEAALADGRVLVLLRAGDSGTVEFAGQAAAADLAAVRFDAAGKPVAHLAAAGGEVRAGPGPLPR